MSWDTHDRGCTPLVTWAMGTSLSGRDGHSARHIRRETAPWRRLTPLLYAESRRARTVRQKSSPSLRGSSRPSARKSFQERPMSRERGPKYFSIRAGANRSFPAGTHVWVVKRLVAHTYSLASAKE